MAFYQFRREQFIPADLETVWEFISSPENLKKITPENMGFDITTDDLPDKIYPGMIISYRVKPLAGIQAQWVTEITQVVDKQFFIDEQRIGPYAFWHHQHFIEKKDDGVLMKDIVSYAPPFGVLGRIANRLIIRKKLNEIFAYRSEAMEKLFGKKMKDWII